MTPVSDADIMRQVQAGDIGVFDELVHRYRQPLLRAAWSKLGDWTWAEDVVQEALLAAYAARATYKPQFAFRTWLWTILLNLCSRQWKRQGSDPRLLSLSTVGAGNSQANSEPAVPDTALQQLLQTEQHEQLRSWLAQLPEVQADALRLRFFGELQFDEIAAVMGSSLSAAKVRVKHGLRTLSQLSRDGEGNPQ